MSSTLFKIYTESHESLDDKTLAIASDILHCFTVYHAVGYWQGKREDSLVIEYVAECAHTGKARILVGVCADRIALANSQDSVLVTEQPIDADFRANPSLEFKR